LREGLKHPLDGEKRLKGKGFSGRATVSLMRGGRGGLQGPFKSRIGLRSRRARRQGEKKGSSGTEGG